MRLLRHIVAAPSIRALTLPRNFLAHMCPEIYCGPSLRRRGSLRKSSHTAKYAPVFGSPRSLQPGLLATISGHIFTGDANQSTKGATARREVG
jgi:hypothetical protein